MSLLARRSDRSIILASRLLSATLICGILYGAKIVLIPLAFSILIAFMLYPLVRRLRRFHLPNTGAVVLVVASAAAGLAGLSWLIGAQIAGFSAELPQYEQNITRKISSFRSSLKGGTIDKLQDAIANVTEEVEEIEEAKEVAEEKESGTPRRAGKPASEEPVPVYITTPPSLVSYQAMTRIGPMVAPLTSIGLVLLLSVLMLLKWSELRGRMLAFLENNLAGTTSAMDDAGQRIRRFLGTQFLYNASFGLIAGTGLAFLGVPYAPLWGLCAALFRYIPYAGPVVAAALPLLVSLVTSDGWSQVLSVGILFLVLELVSNNLVEPWLYGSRVGLSEIGIIVAAVVWTFLWGPSGLVLATPLTVCLVVLGEHLPALTFISRLLGSKPTVSTHFHLYQRLLADDALEAADLAKGAMLKDGPAGAVENVFLPALSLARREWMAGRLPADQAERIGKALPAVFEASQPTDEDDDARDAPATGAAPGLPLPPVTFWATCALSDAVLPLQDVLLGDLCFAPDFVTAKQFAGAVVARLAADPPTAICLIHLDPHDFARVRARVLRIRAALPDTPLVVARLGGATFDAEERATLATVGATALVTTLAALRSFLAPRLLDYQPPPRAADAPAD